METTIENVRFNALRNALYHTARRLAYDRLDRWFNFLVIALGTGAVADITGCFKFSAPVIGAVVAVIGALQLVFAFGRNARDHQGFQRQYYEILAEIEENPQAGADAIATWQGKMIRIACEEPPVMRAVDARAYNDAIDALEMDKGQRLVIPRFHKMAAQFIAFEGYNYPKVCELEETSGD